MKILAVADEEEKALWDYYDPSRTKDVNLVISCGDLNPDYLQFLESMVNVPLLYVRGNHDNVYDQRPPYGCIDIDDKIYDFHGLRILGLGGSMRYHEGGDMYSESEMKKRIRKLNRTIALRNGFDVLVTHAPAKGYGDMDDLPHRGFECFNELLERWKPRYMLHGHVHKTYSSTEFERTRKHSCGTTIINTYGSYLFDVGDNEHPAKGKTGSALYDLYVSLTERNSSHGL